MLVARSDRPLSELPAVRGVAALEESVLRAGWRSAKLDGDPDGVLPALVADTGAPVLTAYVLDSDLADVQALTPGGLSWRAYLHEETALEYGAPSPPYPRDEVLQRATAWAVEADLTATATALEAALDNQNVFVEDTFAELLDALGLTSPS
ncbi:hypothetical protein C1I93_12610 [Micromonospora endophytica]|uniref:Uncharacterized protein n=2 Tax=Micromonospora endophytica TaxID=515350 RepID=A0A2W2DIY4_9ACTN|nr:hypothetical protein [Micromonospora endophytica]PZF97166.1 hypothetical protein C1I93_12610 [Micromonospora endophytica]RIW46194.1 hypothetical protein D3H59_12780 [Micromonospora endophytica]